MNQMDKREADDPCFYLLAIWSPGISLRLVPHIRILDVNELLLGTILHCYCSKLYMFTQIIDSFASGHIGY